MKNLSDYLKPRPRFVAPVICCCLALLGCAAWISVEASLQHQQLVRTAQRYEALRASQVVPAPPKLKPSELEDLKRWAALRMERAFSWDVIFLAIEHAGSADIELLEFNPAKLDLALSLRGEARNHEALVEFLEALSRQPALGGVHLTRQKKKVRGQLETIEFEVRTTIVDRGRGPRQ
ncbi:PilN domain-containing protein [Duganella sp. BuS-21]|uniref:PilN domain-containing protein n=1 Tax=Duganella sp. BuS-21 TaxID=2943848 RepID=UPI0035A6A77D